MSEELLRVALAEHAAAQERPYFEEESDGAAAEQYYAHPRNHFWPLVAAVTGVPLSDMPYRRRLAALRASGIGLWDAIVACRRHGSLDGAIRDATHGEAARVRRAAPRSAR